MLLAEANQWPEDAVAYFADGDECHMAFHFPLMPRLFMAIRMEDRFPVMEILQETPPIPDNCQWALFLRNHDELTLEMVTDEERDYMYRVYAHDRRMRINLGIRRRLAPLLENDRRKIELMNALLFSLPGTPVIYYGDEIGMGDNIYLGDRNGVRTPMQWSADRNAGFSRANPQKLYLPITIDPAYHYEAINVEAQQNNPHSLLWWTKHLIEQRKQFKALGRGTLEFLRPSNRKVLAFFRRYEDEIVLVIANLSRFPQHVELDLAGGEGHDAGRDFRARGISAGERPAVSGDARLAGLLLVCVPGQAGSSGKHRNAGDAVRLAPHRRGIWATCVSRPQPRDSAAPPARVSQERAAGSRARTEPSAPSMFWTPFPSRIHVGSTALGTGGIHRRRSGDLRHARVGCHRRGGRAGEGQSGRCLRGAIARRGRHARRSLQRDFRSRVRQCALQRHSPAAAFSRTIRRTGGLAHARLSRRLGREPSRSRTRRVEGRTIQHVHCFWESVHPQDLSPRGAWYPSGSGDRDVPYREEFPLQRAAHRRHRIPAQ